MEGGGAELEVSGGLADYLRPLRRHVLLIIATGALCLLAGILLIPGKARVFRSQSDVLLGQGLVSATLTGDRGDSEADIGTEKDVASSAAVAALAATKLGTGEDPERLRSNLTVVSPRDSRVLSFSFSSQNREQAQRGAQAFAEAYLEHRAVTLEAPLASRRDQLRVQYEAARTALDAANALVVATEPNSSDQNAAVASRDIVLKEFQTVDEALFGLTGMTVDAGTVIDPANLPVSAASDPRATRLYYLAGALLAGIALGVLGAYVREALDDRVLSRDTLERQLGLPVLGAVPKVATWGRKPAGFMTRVANPVSEDFRAMRAAFVHATDRATAKVTLVTSSSGREGKTTVASGLAASLARSGRRVILISADLWAPSMHRHFAIEDEPGLAEAITSDLPIDDVLAGTNVANLRIVPSRRNDDHELLSKPEVSRLIEEARLRANDVIIDCSPLVVADALALAPQVDRVLLVVDAGTGRGVVERSVKTLEEAGAVVLGSVLNRYSVRSARTRDAAYGDVARTRRRYLSVASSKRRRRSHPPKSNKRTPSGPGTNGKISPDGADVQPVAPGHAWSADGPPRSDAPQQAPGASTRPGRTATIPALFVVLALLLGPATRRARTHGLRSFLRRPATGGG